MKHAPAPLPHAPIRTVLGLVEHLKDVSGGREDLYKLGGLLGFKLDELLPVTEAAKTLGLATVADGDIELTNEGRALAEAEEAERKRRLGAHLRALPQIAEIRKAVEKKRAPKKRFQDRLEKQFSPAEAERQLATALDWARYGEVFDFDQDAEEFFLAPQE